VLSSSGLTGAFRLRTCRGRMLSSAMNFAPGFFGWPLEVQYLQSIIVEEKGVRHESHFTYTYS